MREIDGFVLRNTRPNPNGCFHLFGRPVTVLNNYQLLSTNGIQPFRSLKEALTAKQLMEIDKRGNRVHVKQLNMKVAETPEDTIRLKKNHTLIIVQFDATDLNHHTLLGTPIAGRPKLCNCVTELDDTELNTFRSYAATMYAADEVRRQLRCEVAIASFRLIHVAYTA